MMASSPTQEIEREWKKMVETDRQTDRQTDTQTDSQRLMGTKHFRDPRNKRGSKAERKNVKNCVNC